MTTTIVRGAAALLLAASISGLGVSSANAGTDFPSAVSRVLMGQHEGPVSRLSVDKKRALVACVNDVLADLPNGKKRFIVQASDDQELEHRFGKVVMENRAEWKQKIARGCAHIVV